MAQSARVIIDCNDPNKAWEIEKALKMLGVHRVRMEVTPPLCAPCSAENHSMHRVDEPCHCPCGRKKTKEER